MRGEGTPRHARGDTQVRSILVQVQEISRALWHSVLLLVSSVLAPIVLLCWVRLCRSGPPRWSDASRDGGSTALYVIRSDEQPTRPSFQLLQKGLTCHGDSVFGAAPPMLKCYCICNRVRTSELNTWELWSRCPLYQQLVTQLHTILEAECIVSACLLGAKLASQST